MRKIVYIAFVFLLCAADTRTASASTEFLISITDNNSSRSSNISYTFTNDSLKVFAVTEFGRTRLEYFKRKLSAKECRKLRTLARKWAGKGDENFFNEANIDHSNSDRAPREISLLIEYGRKQTSLRVYNCYFWELAEILSLINELVPEELKTTYRPENFNTEC